MKKSITVKKVINICKTYFKPYTPEYEFGRAIKKMKCLRGKNFYDMANILVQVQVNILNAVKIYNKNKKR